MKRSLNASCSVVLYKYFKYLGFAMILFSLLTYDSLSHNPMMLFVMDMLQKTAYVYMKRSDVRDAYTSDRYECMSSDCP